MGHTTRTDSSTATPCTDEQFLELVYADEDLLRAEFDAIIAAEWPSPPSDPGSAAEQRPGRADHLGDIGADLWSQAPDPGIRGRARQRSPPGWQPWQAYRIRKGR